MASKWLSDGLVRYPLAIHFAHESLARFADKDLNRLLALAYRAGNSYYTATKWSYVIRSGRPRALTDLGSQRAEPVWKRSQDHLRWLRDLRPDWPPLARQASPPRSARQVASRPSPFEISLCSTALGLKDASLLLPSG